MNESRLTSRIISININLTDFTSARVVTADHLKIMRRYASPWMGGPPASDILIELVAHMFTEDEAEVVRHLPILRPQTAETVAKRSGLPLQVARQRLDHCADLKRVILAGGNPRKYTILPVVPGTFEMALMTTDLSSRNEWHRKFSEIFERLWETGYMADYHRYTKAPVRYLPVRRVQDTLHRAWPSQKLEEILEPFDLFAVGHCQCRMAMEFVGKGCGKPTENCLAFGPAAQAVIDRDMMRAIDRDEAIAIKRDAEENGCVSWMINAGGSWGNSSCSCCGCCCHGLRTAKEFNIPGIISRPHFLPDRNVENCTMCMKCARVCPMDAWIGEEDGLYFNSARCIGCGLCVIACKFDALDLKPVEAPPEPEQSRLRLIYKMLPGHAVNSAVVFARRIFGGASRIRQ